MAALDNLEFEPGELEEIDQHAVDGGINLWEASSRTASSADRSRGGR